MRPFSADHCRPATSFWRAGRALLFCLLGLGLWLLTAQAQGPYEKAPEATPQVLITVGKTTQSPWLLDVDAAENRVEVRHRDYAALRLEVDVDGPEQDGRYEGIVLRIGDLRYEGKLYGNVVGFLSPDHDAGRTERLSVKALDTHLRVRFEGGSYRKLSPAGSDDPVFFEAAFFIDKQHRLNAVLNGLYYVFPSADGTKVSMQTRSGETQRNYSAETPKGYEYIEQVLRVEVDDPRLGMYRLEGLIERMQLHAHGQQNADVVEIDLDHTYKDRGQAAVLQRFLLMQPLQPTAQPPSLENR